MNQKSSLNRLGLLKSNLNKYQLLYTSVVIFLMFFLNPLAILLFLFFPGVILFKLTKSNSLFILPIIFVLNISVMMCSGVLIAMLRIPLTVNSLLVFNFIASVCFFIWTKRRGFHKIIIAKSDFITTVALYAIFLVALYAFVQSVIGVSAPILHDPLAHAFWAKQISDTHTINYFYSPGLHIVIMTISKIFGISFALSTLYVTNIFCAFTILTFGIAAYLVTKSRAFSVISALMIFVFPFPSQLYYVGGKNAFVVALAFAPLVFYFLNLLVKDPNSRNCLLFTLSLTSIFVIHYPTGGQIAIFSFAVIAATLIYKLSTPKVVLKLLKFAVISGFVLLLVGVSWFAFTNKARISTAANQVIRTVAPGESGEGISGNSGFHPRSSLKRTYSQFKGLSDSYNTSYFPLGAASLVAVGFCYRRNAFQAIALLAFTIFATSYFINLFNLTSLKTVRDTGAMMMFVIFALGIGAIVAFLIDHNSTGKIKTGVIVVAMATLLFHVGLEQHDKYSNNTSAFEMVDARDTTAFKWIKSNLDSNALFLNNAIRTERKNEIVLPTDGGSWIPVYLDNPVTMAFQDGLFSKEKTHANYDLYEELSIDPQAAICSLSRIGVQYYYNDLRTPYVPAVDVVNLAPRNSLNLVYKNSGVEIYRISNTKAICKNT